MDGPKPAHSGTLQNQKQKLIQIRNQITALENELERLMLTSLEQRKLYDEREKEFQRQIANLRSLHEEEQMTRYTNAVKDQFAFFKQELALQLQAHEENHDEKIKALDEAVDLQYQQQIDTAQKDAKDQLSIDEEEIMRRALPQQFIDDYIFIKQWTADLQKQNDVLTELLKQRRDELAMAKDYQSELLKEEIKLKETFKNNQKYAASIQMQQEKAQLVEMYRREIIRQRASEITHERAVKKPLATDGKTPQQANGFEGQAHLKTLIQNEQKQLVEMQKLPTPIRSFIEELFQKYGLADKQKAVKYSELQENKRQTRLHRVKSVFEEKFQLEKVTAQHRAEYIPKIDVGVFDELSRNALLFETALAMK